MATSDSKVLGVVLLIRHGDRAGFYQSPTTYTASNTVLTPLGNQQEFQLGQQLRSKYLNLSSPSYIAGLSDSIVNDAQLLVRADGGGEGVVIMNSAISLLQGLYPPNPNYNVTLANSSTINGPLGGYQYIPIHSVEPNLDVSLEGWTSCAPFTTHTSQFYNSTGFQAMANAHASFLQSLPPFLDGRSVSLQDMWNIWDFMNVQSIYNAAFANALPSTYLQQARFLANYHEHGVFSSPSPSGIGNIAGHTILPSIISALKGINDTSNPVKLVYQAISYKPFISLFNITGVESTNPQLAGIVNYAAAIALEVRQPTSGGEPVLRFNFKNGTDDPDFITYKFLNSTNTDVPLSDFINAMEPLAINTTADWCARCGNTQDRGCGALALAAASAVHHEPISPVGAGFLGAGLTIAVTLAMFGVLLFLGVLSVKKGQKKASHRSSDTDSEKRV